MSDRPRTRALGVWMVLAAAPALGQQLVGLPLSDPDLDSAIAGRVCLDRDGDGRCSEGEPGAPGVRLMLETGQQATTDAHGRYHLAGVSGRAPDLRQLAGGRLLPGRHRLRLDDRALPSGTRATPAAVTLEVPMGSLVRQDFALTASTETLPDLAASPQPQPLSSRIEPGRVRFLVSGQAAPGDRVTIDGKPAEVDAAGGYRLSVELPPGGNDLTVTAVSPGGAVRLFVQRVDVFQREGGYLVVPRLVEPTAVVQLPAARGEAAATGPTSIRVRSQPGTRISHPGGEAVVGPDGAALIPLELHSGENAVPLRVERPGQPPRLDRLEISAAPRPFAVGLLDVEGSYEPRRQGLRLFGRGAAHVQQRIGRFELSGELDLRDQDVEDVELARAWVLATARRPDALERALDPEEYPIEWADDSVTTATNPAEGRLRLQLRSDDYGALGFGTRRAAFADSEVGRYRRELFGPHLDLHTPASPTAQGGVRGFFDPGFGDPTRELALAPAHEELRATGGSLYYLGSPAVSRGSEVVRIEVRDGLTGLPVRELHLARGRDYEIDYTSGRILLARPLSFATSEGPLRAEPPTSNPEPVLVVEYERVLLAPGGSGTSAEARTVAGGEVTGSVGPVRAALGAVQERGDATGFSLLRGRASAPLGPVTLFVEAAQSRGAAFAPDGFGVSDDGGLTFLRPARAADGLNGQALGLRLRGPGLSKDGTVDVAFRRRTPGFSDGAHQDLAGLRQLSVRGDQTFGDFRLGLLADDRLGADPRDPFGPRTAASRTLGGSVGFQRPDYGVTLEARDAQLSASPDLVAEPVTGGRTALGLLGRCRVHERVTLIAGHKQVLATRGEGLGAFDDSFTSAGADLKLDDGAQVGLRGGWGPRLGPQVWGHADVQSGRDVYYGGYSVDVDGPHLGERRTVSGARTAAADGTAVFVEDIATHDANALRLSRAVGLSQAVGAGLEVTARYERAARPVLDIAPTLSRDAAGVTASWVRERFRAYGRAELRLERGTAQLGPPVTLDRTQRLVGVGGEVQVLKNLRGSVRGTFSDTHGRPDAQGETLEARLVEGSAGLAWRLEDGMVVLRYSLERELSPRSRGGSEEGGLQIVSLMPAVRLGSRFALAAGAHAAWSDVEGDTDLVLTGTVRPSVKVVGGLELAVEVARRTSAPDRGELTALRGEAGYRFNEQMLLALGYTAFGFSGLGLPNQAPDSRDRLYLRAELAY